MEGEAKAIDLSKASPQQIKYLRVRKQAHPPKNEHQTKQRCKLYYISIKGRVYVLLIKNSLYLCKKVDKEEQVLMNSGRLFHKVGPENLIVLLENSYLKLGTL